MLIIVPDNGKNSWRRLGAAPVPWAIKKPKTDVNPRALAPVAPSASAPVLDTTPATAPPPVPSRPVVPKPVAPSAPSPQPSIPAPITPMAPAAVPAAGFGTLDSLANAFHATEDSNEKERIVDQILNSGMPDGKSTVKEFLNNAIRYAPKTFTGDIMSILFTALRRHVSEKRDKDIGFANRLLGTAKHIGKDINLNIRAKSKIKNIWDERAKDFAIPHWIQSRIPIPEHVTDPQATRLLQGQRAYMAYAWKNWEYDGKALPPGTDPNNPPPDFAVGKSKDSRVKRAFDEFNKTTDILLQLKKFPRVPPVNYNDGKKSHQDTRAHYKTRYKQMGLLEPLERVGLSELSPYAIRGQVLNDAVKANAASNGEFEKKINSQLPANQQISLNKTDWENGGRFWVRDDMVNPINKSLSPSQLMNLRDLARQRKQSLDQPIGEDGELQDLLQDENASIRDMAEGRSLRGTEIEPKMELADPASDLMPLPMGQPGISQDRIKKKNFSLPLLRQVMEDWLLKAESDNKTTSKERKHVGAMIMDYIERTQLPPRQLYERIKKELGTSSDDLISKQLVNEADMALLSGYTIAYDEKATQDYVDEYGVQPSAEQAAAFHAKAQQEGEAKANLVKMLANDLVRNIADIGASIHKEMPEALKWYRGELEFEAEDEPEEAALKGNIAEAIMNMVRPIPDRSKAQNNLQTLNKLQTSPVLQAPISWEKAKGKHLLPNDRLVHLVNEVSQQLLGQMFHNKLEQNEAQKQATKFIANQIRLAKFVLLSGLLKAA